MSAEMLAMTWVIARAPEAVSVLRRRTLQVLRQWLPGVSDETADDFQLLVSELVTNGVRYDTSPQLTVGMVLSPLHDEVFLQVIDGTAPAAGAFPAVRQAGALEESGRGLFLVDQLTGHNWGADATVGGGKLVWGVLPIPEPPAPAPVRGRPPAHPALPRIRVEHVLPLPQLRVGLAAS
ncbi:ATP-binding protein [Streptacidiphilus sp. PAMC 29251]